MNETTSFYRGTYPNPNSFKHSNNISSGSARRSHGLRQFRAYWYWIFRTIFYTTSALNERRARAGTMRTQFFGFYLFCCRTEPPVPFHFLCAADVTSSQNSTMPTRAYFSSIYSVYIYIYKFLIIKANKIFPRFCLFALPFLVCLYLPPSARRTLSLFLLTRGLFQLRLLFRFISVSLPLLYLVVI